MLMRKSILNVIRGCILLLATVLLICCGNGDNALEEIIKGGSSGDIPEVIAKYEFSVTDLAETFDITEDITSIELTNDEGSVIATAELSEGKYTVDKSKLASVTAVWVKAIQGEGGDAKAYIQRLTAADLTTLEAEKKLKMATLGDLMNSDGTFSAAAETGKTPIGVIAYLGNDAFTEAIADGGGHGLVLCLKNAPTKVIWSTANTAYEFGESAKVDAKLDLIRTTNVSGYTNTLTMVGKDDPGTNYPAAYQARTYHDLTVPTWTTGWFLPSAQQWVRMQTGLGGLDEDDIVWSDDSYNKDHTAADNWEAALGKAGTAGVDYDSMTDAEYLFWSSSENSVGNAVYLRVDATTTGDGYGFYWNYNDKNDTWGKCYVRPVLAF